MRIHYEFLQEELYAEEKPYTAYGILIRDADTGTVRACEKFSVKAKNMV